jgi:hypothetical protein
MIENLERARHGFSDQDVWSFNHYLAGVIAGGLIVLRDNLHGCPPELVENGDVDAGVKRWAEILTEMAAGFQLYYDEDDPEVALSPEFKRSLELLTRWWADLWD